MQCFILAFDDSNNKLYFSFHLLCHCCTVLNSESSQVEFHIDILNWELAHCSPLAQSGPYAIYVQSSSNKNILYVWGKEKEGKYIDRSYMYQGIDLNIYFLALCLTFVSCICFWLSFLKNCGSLQNLPNSNPSLTLR